MSYTKSTTVRLVQRGESSQVAAALADTEFTRLAESRRLGPILIVLLLLAHALSGALLTPAQAGPTNMIYAVEWGKGRASAIQRNFETWTSQFLSSTDPSRTMMHAEGVKLARARRQAMLDLIRSNPEQALALTIPPAVHKQLPADIREQLETRISGIGDYSVICSLPLSSDKSSEPFHRFVRLDGKTYEAHVYGRRSSETSKQGIPLHGIVLDGHVALHEAALRELGPSESPDAWLQIRDLRSVEQKSKADGLAIQAEAGGTVYRFSSRDQLNRAERLLEDAEVGLAPAPTKASSAILGSFTDADRTGAAGSDPVQNSAWTEGQQRVLIIRVDFSDLPGDPGNGTYTASYAQDFMDTQIKPYYEKCSYGLTTLATTVTRLYRMPRTAVYYSTNGDIHADATLAASANYNLANYDRIMAVFSFLGDYPGSNWRNIAGMALVGGSLIWINGYFDFRVVTHELGHTYGLWHANEWAVSDGNPISSAGASAEYADDYDPMGANFADDQRTDFNPWFKSMLNWIRADQVLTVTTSGTYRINRFDNSTGSGILALKIPRDATRNYWIGCRRNFTDNLSMQHGAYILWGYNDNNHSDLLDMTPLSGVWDAALTNGAMLGDPIGNFAIRVLSEGGVAPNEYLDIQVSSSLPPIFTLNPRNRTLASGGSAILAAAASGFPAPTYRWQRRANGSGPWNNLNDDAKFSGSTTSTLTVSDADVSMDADQFRCLASNTAGAASSDPATINVIPYLAFFDDMESGGGQNWYGYGGWEMTTLDSHSPNACWTDSAAGNYENNHYAQLNSFPLDLAGKATVTLSFWHRFDFAHGDEGRLLVGVVGEDAVPVRTFRGTASTWHRETVDLSEFAGRNIYFAFALSSDASDVADGWYFDDVLVTADPRPTLTGMTRANGVSSFAINGPVGGYYTTQASSNLVNWATISTNIVALGRSALVRDTNATNLPQRFYRVKARTLVQQILVPWYYFYVSPPFYPASGYITQTNETTVTSGGRATYSFTMTNSGVCVIKASVQATDAGSDSFYINMDAEPQDPAMTWDLPHSADFVETAATWRNLGGQPKAFNLSAGTHQIIIRGREADAKLQNISILIYQ